MMMPPNFPQQKMLLAFAMLGLVLVVGGLFFFLRPLGQTPSELPEAPVEAALGPDPCITDLLDSQITPCQVLVYLRPDVFSSLDEVQRQEVIDEMMGTSQLPVTSYRLLPSQTDVILSLSTPPGKEEQLGQQMVEIFPAYVEGYQTLDNVPIIFN